MTAALRALLAAASPRPWRAVSCGYSTEIASPDVVDTVVSVDYESDWVGCEHWVEISDDNAALIVGAVNALPALLDLWGAEIELQAWRKRHCETRMSGLFVKDRVDRGIREAEYKVAAALSKLDEVAGC